jgi:hypothetical protein
MYMLLPDPESNSNDRVDTDRVQRTHWVMSLDVQEIFSPDEGWTCNRHEQKDLRQKRAGQ